jgi:hypothetical protein
VFSGISVVTLLRCKKKGPFATEDLRPVKREKAWEEYERGNEELAWKGWSTSGIQTYFIATFLITFSRLYEPFEYYICRNGYFGVFGC